MNIFRSFIALALILTTALGAYSQGKPSVPQKSIPAIKPNVNKQKTQTTQKSTQTTQKSTPTKTQTQTYTRTDNNSTTGNPTKKVIYTLGNREKLYYTEISSNMKSRNNQFLLVTEDGNTGKLNLILNGTKIASGKGLEVFDINFESPNPVNYAYTDGNGYYFGINGKKVGPFEAYDYQYCNNGRMILYGKRMGKWFRIDIDGSTYYLGDDIWSSIEKEATYSSPNGYHKLKFSDYYKYATIDGIKFLIPMGSIYNSADLSDVVVMDNGDAYFELRAEKSGGTDYLLYKVTPGGIMQIMEDQYRANTAKRTGISNANREQGFDASYENLADDSWDGDWFKGLDIVLQDKTNSHTFIANWNYDYVMVDGSTIKCTSPFYAFYDPSSNTFSWVSQEGKDFVLYTYSL